MSSAISVVGGAERDSAESGRQHLTGPPPFDPLLCKHGIHIRLCRECYGK